MVRSISGCVPSCNQCLRCRDGNHRIRTDLRLTVEPSDEIIAGSGGYGQICVGSVKGNCNGIAARQSTLIRVQRYLIRFCRPLRGQRVLSGRLHHRRCRDHLAIQHPACEGVTGSGYHRQSAVHSVKGQDHIRDLTCRRVVGIKVYRVPVSRKGTANLHILCGHRCGNHAPTGEGISFLSRLSLRQDR